jgi:hypothetical protein
VSLAYLGLSPERGQVVYHFAIGIRFPIHDWRLENKWPAMLVHGNNHFILSGPVPDDGAALALPRHWSVVQIGESKSSSFRLGDSVEGIP